MMTALMTGRNPIANYVEPRGGTECTEDATSVDYCCSDVDATNNCFHYKGQEEEE